MVGLESLLEAQKHLLVSIWVRVHILDHRFAHLSFVHGNAFHERVGVPVGEHTTAVSPAFIGLKHEGLDYSLSCLLWDRLKGILVIN